MEARNPPHTGSSLEPLNLAQQVVQWAIEIQQVAAPTFQEAQRAELVLERFQAAGLADVTLDAVGNVLGRLPGREAALAPVVVSAHLDTVFPYETDLATWQSEGRIYGPGLGDNSIGVAALLGLAAAWPTRPSALPGDLWLVANVGEEGLGDLRGMRSLVDRFGDQPRVYLVLEGMALGQIYHRALGVRRYRLRVNAPGGHSWVDYGQPSAIHELARLVIQLLAIPIPTKPRASLNVGVIRGGTSVNTLAAEAELELDLRAESPVVLNNLRLQVENLVQAANCPPVQASFEQIGKRPAGELSRSHPMVSWAEQCLRAQGLKPSLQIGSTDANIPLSQGLPAICLGVTRGGGAHTTGEYILTAPVASGLAQIIQFITGAFEIN